MWRTALPQVTVLIGMLTTLVYSAACFDRWLPLHCACQHHTHCHLVPGLFLPSLFVCCSVLGVLRAYFGCFTCMFWVFYMHALGGGFRSNVSEDTRDSCASVQQVILGRHLVPVYSLLFVVY